jgi:hypothetical protein
MCAMMAMRHSNFTDLRSGVLRLEDAATVRLGSDSSYCSKRNEPSTDSESLRLWVSSASTLSLHEAEVR